VAVLALLVGPPAAGANVKDLPERVRSSLAPAIGGLAMLGAIDAAPAPLSVDESFAAVASRIPAFAGAYIDWRARSLHIRMTDPGPGAALAKQALIDVTGNPVLSRLTPVAREADYGFAQLKTWYDRLAPSVLTMRGTVFTDIDERQNRLVVGVERPARQGVGVVNELRALGIPREAVIIERARPDRRQQCQNLRSRCRPLVGGLQIDDGSDAVCTLGFVARRAGLNGFVTNAHCTPVVGNVDGTVFAQPTFAVANRVGTETADPAFGTPPGCPPAKMCRFSDSAFVRARHGHHHVQLDRGAIAVPPHINTTGAETCPGGQS
jgi:hypothetical protein